MPAANLPSRSEQRRIALDGKAYTRSEFGTHYGRLGRNLWKDAPLAHDGLPALAFSVPAQSGNITYLLEDMLEDMFTRVVVSATDDVSADRYVSKPESFDKIPMDSVRDYLTGESNGDLHGDSAE